MELKTELRYLEDRWDDNQARGLDEVELLRYRSNLLGSDLRITNFGGGNTSSKIKLPDPIDGSTERVLWVKGSGGDLGSIQRTGFAALYLDKVLSLEKNYRGAEFEDEMVEFYSLCAFGKGTVATSIDTPLHAFLPFAHVDHLHPDWAIALAASANGKEKMEQFNDEFGHHLIWLPWQRPGFELAMMLRQAVEEAPRCDGVLLGGHGLFTWGETQRECYENTLAIIDHLGQFVLRHTEEKKGQLFGGRKFDALPNRQSLAVENFPYLRGRVSGSKGVIGHYTDLEEVQRFINSRDAAKFARLGTSCPDHFIRTKVRPLFVEWEPGKDVQGLRSAIDSAATKYREEYAKYYRSFAQHDSPAMRDADPTVVLIPGIGMFSFGKSKTEARLAGEFYVNAIHVMEGAAALGDSSSVRELPQAGKAAPSSAFEVYSNYVALPLSEAFKIEYWQLEEAKIRRQPAEKELSRKILLVVGGGSGIGKEAALLASQRGAHVAVADIDGEAAHATSENLKGVGGKEASIGIDVDICRRESIRRAIETVVAAFGGVDIVINTAALFPSSPDGKISDEQWSKTLDVNVTANYLLADEAARVLKGQGTNGSIVLTSSANAVVPKKGSEVYDLSKAAVSHLVRELAVSLAPKIRVNGISPATVVKGSTMFPRERVIASLKKYEIPFLMNSTDNELRSLLAAFYAKRTLTHEAIEPRDCAEAILYLAGPKSRCTTGHLIPVDGGLVEAFLR